MKKVSKEELEKYQIYGVNQSCIFEGWEIDDDLIEDYDEYPGHYYFDDKLGYAFLENDKEPLQGLWCPTLRKLLIELDKCHFEQLGFGGLYCLWQGENNDC